MARERYDVPMREWKRRERALVQKQEKAAKPHDCWDHAEYVETDGALGQAYYCAVCGALLQVG